MQKNWVLAAVLSAALAGGCEGFGGGKHEVKITMEQVPAAVKATFDREAKGGKITELEKEVEKGKTVYSADITVDGKQYDVKVADDGTLLKKKLEEKDEEKD